MELQVLGIRHHGVGSAKNLLEKLLKINPDHIIIEGPEELMDCFSKIDLNTIFSLITNLNEKLSLLENKEQNTVWIECLRSMADQKNVSALIKGAIYRILLDNNIYDHKKLE